MKNIKIQTLFVILVKIKKKRFFTKKKKEIFYKKKKKDFLQKKKFKNISTVLHYFQFTKNSFSQIKDSIKFKELAGK